MLIRSALGVIALGLAAAIVAFLVASRSNAGGPPNPGAGVQPGFVGQTPPPTATARPLPGMRAATTNSNALIQQIEANAPGNGVERGTAHAELHTAGELPNLTVRYVSDYPIWVVTVHGKFQPISAPPGAHVPPLTTEIMYFDAYTGEPVGEVLSTDNFTPRRPGAGVPVTAVPTAAQ